MGGFNKGGFGGSGGGGGGGGTGAASNHITYRVVASATASTQQKNSADYVCTGSNDQVQINQAITDCYNAGANPFGIVRLVGPLFVIGNGHTDNGGSIKMQTGVYVIGDERWPTRIQAASTFVTTGVGNFYGLTSITTALAGMVELNTGTEQFIGLENVELDGNLGAGARVLGVYWNFTGGTPQFSDDSPTITNLYVYNTAGANLCMLGNQSGAHGRAASCMSVRGINAGGSIDGNVPGVYCAMVDSSFHDFNIGSAASHGIVDAGANNRWSNCKSWFAGGMASTFGTGNGYNITAPRIQMSNCEAQDCFGHGFALNGNQSLSSCHADSCGYPNGHGTAPTGDGFFISGSGVAMAACQAYDKNESSRGVNMSYGIEFSSTGLKGLSIDLVVANTVSGGWNPANVPPGVAASAANGLTNKVIIVPSTFYSGGTAGTQLCILPTGLQALGSKTVSFSLDPGPVYPQESFICGANITVTTAALYAGYTQTIQVIQPAAGGPFVPTFHAIGGANVDWGAPGTPTWSTAANAVDGVVLTSPDGVKVYGFFTAGGF